MKNHPAARIVLAGIFLCTTPGMLLMTGCIGTANAGSATLSINPSAPTNVLTGATQQFNVYESVNSGNPEVITSGITWEVNGIPGGDLATIGEISSTGLYTAPSTIPNPATVQVDATEPGLSEALTDEVTITSAGTTPAPTAFITVSPDVITVGGNATLNWSCTNSASATINQSSVLDGLQIGITGSTTVSPTTTTPYQLNCSGPNGSASMTATLTVQSGVISPVTVSVAYTPLSSTFPSGTTIDLNATVENDPLNEGVHWTSSLGATPVSTGPFTATYVTPSVSVASGVQITAVSVADPNASATATFTITPSGTSGGGGGNGECTSAPPSANPPQAAVTPPLIEMLPGNTQTFEASLTGNNVTSEAFTWSIKTTQSVSDLGIITPVSSDSHEITYQAPVTGLPLLVVQLVATSQEYTCISASSTVQIAPQQ